MLEIFFLSYSFVMFRIDFLLSIWVNLHIYIDIVFVGLFFGLKFLIIILYCIGKNEASLLFGEKSKLQFMSSSLGNGKFLFGILYIIFFFWIWRVLFGFEVEFGDSIKFESFKSWGFWYLRLSRLILILHLICFCFIENFYLGSCDFLFS